MTLRSDTQSEAKLPLKQTVLTSERGSHKHRTAERGPHSSATTGRYPRSPGIRSCLPSRGLLLAHAPPQGQRPSPLLSERIVRRRTVW
jgi:hypothetical protein